MPGPGWRTGPRPWHLVGQGSSVVREAFGLIPEPSGFIREASGFNREASEVNREPSGLIPEASGFIREASGFNREASGLVLEASGLVRERCRLTPKGRWARCQPGHQCRPFGSSGPEEETGAHLSAVPGWRWPSRWNKTVRLLSSERRSLSCSMTWLNIGPSSNSGLMPRDRKCPA